MPQDPPRGSCPLGTRHTRTGYFTVLADYFKICGEHCFVGDRDASASEENCAFAFAATENQGETCNATCLKEPVL